MIDPVQRYQPLPARARANLAAAIRQDAIVKP